MALAGTHLSEETRIKISIANKGRHQHHSEEARRKMSLTRRGVPLPEETKRKMSEAHKNRWIKVKENGWKSRAKPLSKAKKCLDCDELVSYRGKRCASCAGKLRAKSSPNYRGGISVGDNRKEYVRRKCLERYYKKKGIGGGHTLGEWINLKIQYDWTCPCCKRREPEIKLSEDHIIPVSRGGSDNIENIQPLCRSCNSKKHTQIKKYQQ